MPARSVTVPVAYPEAHSSLVSDRHLFPEYIEGRDDAFGYEAAVAVTGEWSEWRCVDTVMNRSQGDEWRDGVRVMSGGKHMLYNNICV